MRPIYCLTILLFYVLWEVKPIFAQQDHPGHSIYNPELREGFRGAPLVPQDIGLPEAALLAHTQQVQRDPSQQIRRAGYPCHLLPVWLQFDCIAWALLQQHKTDRHRQQ
ncbi:MAG: hypothetical protein K2X39_06020 [Silvanigrellaceae bacterium]|nr:hypothetical protein [Silvanigrellaceae bacterium]